MILGITVNYLGILMLLWFCIRRIIPTLYRNTEIFTDSMMFGIYPQIIWAQGRVDETMLTAVEVGWWGHISLLLDVFDIFYNKVNVPSRSQPAVFLRCDFPQLSLGVLIQIVLPYVCLLRVLNKVKSLPNPRFLNQKSWEWCPETCRWVFCTLHFALIFCKK